MNKVYDQKQVRDAAVRGFDALYVISRNDVKRVWKNLTREEKYNVARSLIALRNYGKNIDKNLSRAETEDAWHARAKEYAEENGLTNMLYAYYVVADPVNVAMQNAKDMALSFDYGKDGKHCGSSTRWKMFYTLSSQYMNYDYNRTSVDDGRRSLAEIDADRIVNMSKQLTDRANEIKANPFKRVMLQFVNNFKTYQH